MELLGGSVPVDTLAAELIKQVPALGVLAWIVYLFLKDRRAAEKERLTALKDICDDCHEIQKRGLDSIDRNTEVLGAVNEQLRRMNGAKL